MRTINAPHTPIFRENMVLCDGKFGVFQNPIGGVGGIAKALTNGLVYKGSKLFYKVSVKNIIHKDRKSIRVRLLGGRECFNKIMISKATR